jgi:para-aminobenzoate synthetase component 2
VRTVRGKIPLLGVCLGHQVIADVYGMDVVRHERPMHGKTSPIYHDGKGIFAGISDPFEATRYHSLNVRRQSVPSDFEV